METTIIEQVEKNSQGRRRGGSVLRAVRGGGVAQCLRGLLVLQRTGGQFPAYTQQLTIVCNFNSGDPMSSSDLLRHI